MYIYIYIINCISLSGGRHLEAMRVSPLEPRAQGVGGESDPHQLYDGTP